MKKTQILFLVLGLCFLFACNKRNAEKTQETVMVEEEEVTIEDEVEVAIDSDVTEVPPPPPYIMASIRKTACYGTCPVYEFKVFNNGEVRYNGKRFVEREGKFRGHVDKSTVKNIKDKAQAAGYFDFYNQYPTGDVQIADLPTTISYFRIGDMEKTILNKMEAPKALIEYEKFLIDLIETIEWTKVDD